MSNTRDRIVQAANRLFLERGCENVTLRDIASELGIYHGNVTYYFSTKEDLIAEVVGGVYDDLYSSLSFGPDNTVEALLGRFKVLESETAEYAPYIKIANVSGPHYASIEERIIRFRQWYYEYYRKTFEQLVDAGLFRSDISPLYLDIISYHLPIIESTNVFSGVNVVNEKGFSLFDVMCAYIYPLLSSEGLEHWNGYFKA